MSVYLINISQKVSFSETINNENNWKTAFSLIRLFSVQGATILLSTFG